MVATSAIYQVGARALPAPTSAALPPRAPSSRASPGPAATATEALPVALLPGGPPPDPAPSSASSGRRGPPGPAGVDPPPAGRLTGRVPLPHGHGPVPDRRTALEQSRPHHVVRHSQPTQAGHVLGLRLAQCRVQVRDELPGGVRRPTGVEKVCAGPVHPSVGAEVASVVVVGEHVGEAAGKEAGDARLTPHGACPKEQLRVPPHCRN